MIFRHIFNDLSKKPSQVEQLFVQPQIRICPPWTTVCPPWTESCPGWSESCQGRQKVAPKGFKRLLKVLEGS